MICQVQSKDIWDRLLAMAPLLISAVVAWIAWAQYKTSQNKLKLDLYNRRFSIYERTLNYYLAYTATDRSDEFIDKCSADFIRAYRESVFLFGGASPVYQTLTTIKDTLAFLVDFDRRFRTSPYDKDEYRAFSEIKNAKPDMTQQLLELESSLASWLDFRKI